MKKYLSKLSPAILFSFLLLGCGSSQVLTKKPLETKLNQYPNFVFSAETSVAEDVKEEISDLEANVMKNVKELNLFKNMELSDGKKAEEGSLVIKAVITEINKVSGTSRFLLGAFAGKASMTINVLFVDAKTGECIGEFDITGESGRTGYSGGTGQAIQRTADKIAEVISQNYN